MLERESDVFKSVTRVQFPKSNSDTDIYISHNDNYRVLVKGPFINRNKAKIPCW